MSLKLGHSLIVALLTGAFAAILLVAFLFAPVATPAASACASRNGKVAAVAYPGTRQQTISVFRPNGRTYSIYSTKVGSISDFSFSCNGREIVWDESNGEPDHHLELLELGQGEAREVPTGKLHTGSPRFLRDGRILFSGARGGPHVESGTYVVDPGGSHLHKLFRRGQLAASADGRWFVAGDPTGNLHSLFLLDAKGRLVRRLTGVPALHGSEYLNPALSPDGKLIAYEEDIYSPPPHYGHHYVIYTVRRDGTHRRRLTFGSESASEPSFSPDGQWLLFVKTKGEGLGGNVFALRLDDPSKTRKFGLSYGYQYPQWAPR